MSLKTLAKKDFDKIWNSLDYENVSVEATGAVFKALLPTPTPLQIANVSLAFTQSHTPAYIDVRSDDTILTTLGQSKGVKLTGDGWRALTTQITRSDDPLMTRINLRSI